MFLKIKHVQIRMNLLLSGDLDYSGMPGLENLPCAVVGGVSSCEGWLLPVRIIKGTVHTAASNEAWW